MLTIIITAITSILGGGFVTHLFLNKKYKAEVKATEAEAEATESAAEVSVAGEALKLVQSLQTELQNVKNDVHELRNENIDMHKKVAILETERIQLQARIDHLEFELAKYQK